MPFLSPDVGDGPDAANLAGLIERNESLCSAAMANEWLILRPAGSGVFLTNACSARPVEQ